MHAIPGNIPVFRHGGQRAGFVRQGRNEFAIFDFLVTPSYNRIDLSVG